MREVTVYDSDGICKMVQRGIIKRQIAPTLMNHQSSRSHTVFTISVNTSETTISGEEIKRPKIIIAHMCAFYCRI